MKRKTIAVSAMLLLSGAAFAQAIAHSAIAAQLDRR
jgi:hypothetical protein